MIWHASQRDFMFRTWCQPCPYSRTRVTGKNRARSLVAPPTRLDFQHPCLMKDGADRLVADRKLGGQVPQAAGAAVRPDHRLLLGRELPPPRRVVAVAAEPSPQAARRYRGDANRLGATVSMTR
jgi:hypothetical protein